MNFNRNKKRKAIAFLLATCIAVTSVPNFTKSVEASILTPATLTTNKLKEIITLVKDKQPQPKSTDLINYDFSNYRILNADAKKYTHSFYAVNTIVQLIIYNDDPNIDVEKILVETETLVNDYENVISKTKEGSFTYTLNSTGEYDYSNSKYASTIHQLVDKSTYYEELSKGALDVTIEPVVKLWNINNGNTEIPSQSKIDTALTLVDYNNFVRDEKSQKYKLNNGANVDFGAIAKGQLADIIKASLMSKGINSALINLGGNVMTIGAKPGDKNWVIGIQDPTSKTGVSIGTIAVKNKSVVSSGDYEKYFMKDGTRYHHIMDTKTGAPSKSGLIQTTIISDRSIDGDALSTTTFLFGARDGLELIEGMEGFECMLIDENKNIYYSENFVEDTNLKLLK